MPGLQEGDQEGRQQVKVLKLVARWFKGSDKRFSHYGEYMLPSEVA